MKLINNWRQAWRFDTIRVAAALAFLSAVQTDVLPLVRAVVPAAWWPWITGGIALAIILLRLRPQPDLHVDAPAVPLPQGGE